jgi:hypothetical protein
MLTLCRQVLFILCLWHFLKFRLHLVFQIDNLFYTECPQKKRRRVHNSVIYRKVLIICTPN